MAYVSPDFRRKKDLIDALNRGEHVRVYEPGLGSVPSDGTVYLEGPHVPRLHTWYAEGKMEGGRLIKVV